MIIPCHKYGKPGYKFGRNGECHLYTQDNPRSKYRAHKRAEKDGKIYLANRKPFSLINWVINPL